MNFMNKLIKWFKARAILKRIKLMEGWQTVYERQTGEKEQKILRHLIGGKHLLLDQYLKLTGKKLRDPDLEIVTLSQKRKTKVKYKRP